MYRYLYVCIMHDTFGRVKIFHLQVNFGVRLGLWVVASKITSKCTHSGCTCSMRRVIEGSHACQSILEPMVAFFWRCESVQVYRSTINLCSCLNLHLCCPFAGCLHTCYVLVNGFLKQKWGEFCSIFGDVVNNFSSYFGMVFLWTIENVWKGTKETVTIPQNWFYDSVLSRQQSV